IDNRTGAVVPKKPLFGDCRCYLISNNFDVTNTVKYDLSHLRLRDVEHFVDLSVSLQISCRPGNEEHVATALYDAASAPLEVLDTHIKRWLGDFGNHVEGFVR